MIDIEYYLPKKSFSNKELEEKFQIDLSAAEKKIGIKNRYIANEHETSLDMGCAAAKKLLSKTKTQIDFILFCTQSPDYYLPTSACLIQKNLNLPDNIGALDFNLGCSGYIYGLALAKGLLAGNIGNNILLITAESYSKFIHQEDRVNQFIFGDAASATIISKENVALGDFVLGTDGNGAHHLIVKNGCMRSPLESNPEKILYGSGNITDNNHLYMNGPEIFNFTIDKIPLLVQQTLIKNNLRIEDVDYFIFHQANKFMLNFLRKKLEIPENKFYIDLQDIGNTVSSTIPIALKNALDQKLIKKTDRIMLVGFGVGFSWGATIITL